MPTKLSFKKILIISLSATAFILGISELLLQTWELKAYDQMLRLRPLEAPDSRLLLVTITEDDVRKQKWPLSDSKINQWLAKLQSYQPRIIGVNLYRSEQENFASGLKRRDNIIGVCAFSSVGTQEIAPPPTLPINNIGFTDLVTDNDGIVRRSLLFAHSESDKKCTTAASFAHTSEVYAVAFSPDGQTLASATWDGRVHLRKRDGTLLLTIAGHKESVDTVAFSPDGKTIASGSWDKTVKLWRLDGTLVTTLQHNNKVLAIALLSSKTKRFFGQLNDKI